MKKIVVLTATRAEYGLLAPVIKKMDMDSQIDVRVVVTGKPDALMVLGDRYETLAVCAAAMNAQIPIVHLYGGEATEGLIDEAVRNAITKLSYLHFTSTEEYRHRVIQMGENPQRVYTAGAIGVENALHTNFML